MNSKLENQASKFSRISKKVSEQEPLDLKGRRLKTLGWFAAANAAVVLSIVIISGGTATSYIPIFLAMGSIAPMIALWLSKWLAKRAHDIRIVSADSPNVAARELYQIVDTLRQRAGMSAMPEVGIYNAEEMNAFATGMNRNHALIAFSNTLVSTMDEDAIAAVAAHEIAHIANGDMITMSILQGVVNAVVLLVTIPLVLGQISVGFINEDGAEVVGWLVGLTRVVLAAILLFLGNLLLKAFSRKREFAADKMAAELLDADSMVKALNTLKHEENSFTFRGKEAAFASMKISAPKGFLDVFSTHPSIDRRIAALAESQPSSETP